MRGDTTASHMPLEKACNPEMTQRICSKLRIHPEALQEFRWRTRLTASLCSSGFPYTRPC
jgi:hypothetical protein